MPKYRQCLFSSGLENLFYQGFETRILTRNRVVEHEGEQPPNEHAGGEKDLDRLVPEVAPRLNRRFVVFHPVRHRLQKIIRLDSKRRTIRTRIIRFAASPYLLFFFADFLA